MMRSRLLQPVKGGDIRMVQGHEKLSFPLESRKAFLVLGKRLGQDVDGDVTTELGVPGAIDLAHATLADKLEDFVVR